jgi:hypothetical protein
MLYPGAVILPHELGKLSRVCATICDESGFERDSGTARAMAAHVIRLFMNGQTEEWELLETMRNRQKHRPVR